MRAERGVIVATVAVVAAAAFLVAAAPKVEKAAKGGGPGAGAKLPEVRVFEIHLGGEITEQVSFSMPFGPQPKLLRNYTASIRKAAKDESIKGIILRLGMPAISLAQIQELGEALAEFKAAKKKVYCYTEVCTNRDYLLACAADQIVMPPGGGVGLVGLAADVTFYKGLLDWAGIKVEVIHSGKHKTLGEPFSQDKMSEEHRRVFNEFLDEVYTQFLGTIAAGRGITPEQARKLVDGGPYSAQEARAAKLIDGVAYYDEFLAVIGKELGGKVAPVRTYHHVGRKGPDLANFNIFTIFSSLRPKPDIPRTSRPKVVILYVSGIIVPEGTAGIFGQVVTAKSIGKALASVRKDDTVKAVVLRINSPGGAAVTSDIIWREVLRTRKAGKTVVASLSSVAASGGYYIAMAADKIVAHPATITGSIGVIGFRPNLAGLYGKIGITTESFTRGKNASLMLLTAEMTDAQRQRIQALLDATYDEFVTKAADGRKMKRAQMLELATGRVWTAVKAKELGLVDELGGLKRAYDLAIELAGLKGQNVQPVILPRQKDFFEMLLSRAAGGAAMLPQKLPVRLPGPLQRLMPALSTLEALSRQNVLTLMPYTIRFR